MGIDIINFSNSINSTTKTNTKSKAASGNSSFDSLFAKAAYSNGVKNEGNSAKELSQASQKTSKYDDNYKESNIEKSSKVSEADSSKPVPKEVKDALKEAGMSEEEVDKINSLEDLKDKVEPDKLLAMLLSLMNGNLSNVDLSNMKDKIGEQIKAVISADPGKFANVTDEGQLKNNLINAVFDKISNDTKGMIATNPTNVKDATSNILVDLLTPTNENLKVKLNSNENSEINVDANTVDTEVLTKDDILSRIQSELKTVLKDCLKDLKSNKESTSDFASMATNFNGKTVEELIKAVSDGEKTSDNSSMLNDNSSKEEDGFLKNLLSDNNDKISRVTNFMSQFNNMKVDNNAVSDLENIVVNKNTIGTDMIKALKYMQTNNKTDLIVKINPKELGEVVIKITMESGVMKASINAANKEAYNLLNSNLVDITNKLQNTDVKIQDVSLSLYHEDTTFFKDGSDQNRSSSEQKGKKTQSIGAIGEEEIIADNQAEVDSNVNMFA